MTPRTSILEHLCLSEKTAVAIGNAANLNFLKNKCLTLVLDGFAAANDSITIKVQGSNALRS